MTGSDRMREAQLADALSAGEYGATRVSLLKDGSTLRVAFGRKSANGESKYFLAVHLSPEAVQSLKEQLDDLGAR